MIGVIQDSPTGSGISTLIGWSSGILGVDKRNMVIVRGNFISEVDASLASASACELWSLEIRMSSQRTNLDMRILTSLSSSNDGFRLSIPINDPDVLEIRGSEGVRILGPDSALGVASGGGTDESSSVAAMRMPMLRVSNFKGGTPELVDTCYAILVLVLPNAESRVWSIQEMEIMEVVADQVAVALSHAAVLEESQLMREQLSAIKA
ncbi:hypothetical protein LWI29_030146 [Acer saccharum]|uniref:Ethylene receptor n=1 Tax=Acer saccharum TaxID=4024 RepID=A0AA39SET8_ACESA|nr:hypothetical protein LWI29_030146 [Acer saccharum]